jgi:antitoxin (DNA-binding transcriptional repressor) of toxin-antitoxin stability system
MKEVTIRELRDHTENVIARVETGMRFAVTRAGETVAELRPVQSAPSAAATLLERWSKLPRIDSTAFRADIERLLDNSL